MSKNSGWINILFDAFWLMFYWYLAPYQYRITVAVGQKINSKRIFTLAHKWFATAVHTSGSYFYTDNGTVWTYAMVCERSDTNIETNFWWIDDMVWRLWICIFAIQILLSYEWLVIQFCTCNTVFENGWQYRTRFCSSSRGNILCMISSI